MQSIGTWWMWLGFAAFVIVAIAVDLLVMEKQGAHKVTIKEAAVWVTVTMTWQGNRDLYTIDIRNSTRCTSTCIGRGGC